MTKVSVWLLAGSICCALLTGTHCRAAEAEAPPPLGKFYEVGGHRMHLYATGLTNSGPAVVLEAGTGGFSMDWYLVQEKVAQFARVCSYDRAGHAWSELGPRPRTMRQAVYDLHRLLEKASVSGPFVMVGHSAGGGLVRVFAAEYPNDVAGIVLVDAGADTMSLFINGKWEGPFDRVKPRQIPPPRDQIRDDERVLSKPEMDGYKQFREMVGPIKIEEPFDKLPEPIQKLRLWVMALPESNVTDYNPYGPEEGFLLLADRIRLEHPLGSKPLVVLTRRSDDKLTEAQESREKQRKLAEESLRNLSSNSAFMVSDFPVHEIHLTQPDLVVRAIRAVIDSVKTGGQVNLTGSERQPVRQN
jgi:pimeloyl-ACP methyl ester carboxylesterase